jgi:hypothetical protein
VSILIGVAASIGKTPNNNASAQMPVIFRM